MLFYGASQFHPIFPLCFAWYNALSADAIKSSGQISMVLTIDATPKLTVTEVFISPI